MLSEVSQLKNKQKTQKPEPNPKPLKNGVQVALEVLTSLSCPFLCAALRAALPQQDICLSESPALYVRPPKSHLEHLLHRFLFFKKKN